MKCFLVLFFLALAGFTYVHGQETRVGVAAYDGVAVAGYVDEGAFLNFTGPNVSLTVKSSKLILGMLPSLRFRTDHGATRNSFVTPNLGVGLTYCYKAFAVQVPLYYNAKTVVANGSWQIGIGIGLRVSAIGRKK